MDMSLFYLNNVNGPVKRKKKTEKERERGYVLGTVGLLCHEGGRNSRPLGSFEAKVPPRL
jgi:hypothetical protein